jgi:RND family efflux transporter MFP subunit
MDRLEAVISIPETEAFDYNEGMKTEFKLLQDSTRQYEGRLASLDRAVDSRSRTAAARIEIMNRDGKLRPGMVGRARILRRAFSKAVVIPATALLHTQNGVAVMVAENNTARRRIIRTGAASGDGVLVLQGLKSGDKLVISGAFQLSDGSKITY